MLLLRLSPALLLVVTLGACQPDAAELPVLEPVTTTEREATGTGLSRPGVEHVRYGGWAFRALVAYEDLGAGALPEEVACGFATGLARARFAVDVAPAPVALALPDDYDLLVYVLGNPVGGEGVPTELPHREFVFAGRPVVTLAAGSEDLLPRLRELEAELFARGSVLVETAAFVVPAHDWDGPEEPTSVGLAMHHAEQLGQCVGDALQE